MLSIATNRAQLEAEGTPLKGVFADRANQAMLAGKAADPPETLREGDRHKRETSHRVATAIGLGSGRQWDKLEKIGEQPRAGKTLTLWRICHKCQIKSYLIQFIAQPAFVPYNASKGVLMQLTRCLALDLALHNIRVNCVCPGSVLTPATERHRQFVNADREEFLAEAECSNFMKRIADPREIDYGALFLASDEASFVTGTPLVTDGGATAQ